MGLKRKQNLALQPTAFHWKCGKSNMWYVSPDQTQHIGLTLSILPHLLTCFGVGDGIKRMKSESNGMHNPGFKYGKI
jgi:hypothetical protein